MNNEIQFFAKDGLYRLEAVLPGVIRCVHTKEEAVAAPSMLLQTLGAAVQELCKRGLAEEAVVDLRHGQGEVSCVPVAEFRCVVRTVMDSVLLGFALLARDYGEYVCLERTEE